MYNSQLLTYITIEKIIFKGYGSINNEYHYAVLATCLDIYYKMY